MKLLTKEIERRFAQLGSQEDKGDQATVVCKFFTPDSGWTWWALEYNAEDREFFGLVQGHEIEFGYFSLEELETVTGPLGLRVERDLHWKERTIGEVRAALDSRVSP